MTESDYLADVLRVIKDTFRPSDPSGSMPVATLAYLVKQRLKFDYAQLGFGKFKDVLTALEKRGEIRTGLNTRGAYAFWLGGTAPTSATNALTVAPFRPLRSQVWFAFIGEAPEGRRFLNRITGDVRLGLQTPPGSEWCEITPIQSADQKAKSTQFLADYALDSVPELRSALESQRWFSEFPRALAVINPQKASDWNALRSDWVTAEVEKWCAKNDVKSDLVFEQYHGRNAPIVRQRPRGDLRRLLLSAIERMPTDQLLDLPIPPRLIVGELRPDLLDA